MLTALASSSRVAARALSTSARVAKLPLRPTPEAPSPTDLLTKIGRGADKKLADKAASWDELNALWTKGGAALEEAGLGVKDRRYILWAFSRYSQGSPLSEFIRPPRGPKTIRGWGPRVQNGVRVKK